MRLKMQIKTLLLDYLKADKAKYVTLILVAALGLFDLSLIHI